MYGKFSENILYSPDKAATGSRHAAFSDIPRRGRPPDRGLGRRGNRAGQAAPAAQDRGASDRLRRRSRPRDAHLGSGGRLTLLRRAARGRATRSAPRWSTARTRMRTRTRARGARPRRGALVNIVDNLEDSQFITPAIVDRDPVTVAIGTEGAAPVLARRIKADLEERLPAALGRLARRARRSAPAPMRCRWAASAAILGATLFRARPRGAEGRRGRRPPGAGGIAVGRPRRPPRGRAMSGSSGTGPGDPELLTLKARRRCIRPTW